jgi:hypothetical protein
MCYEKGEKLDFYDNIIIGNISVIFTSAFFYNIDQEISSIMIWTLIVVNILLMIYNQIKGIKIINKIK